MALGWKAGEVGTVKAFGVERSFDGRTSVGTGVVAASISRTEYDFVEVSPSNATPALFYRLKLIDKSGTHAYSHVLVLRQNTGDGE